MTTYAKLPEGVFISGLVTEERGSLFYHRPRCPAKAAGRCGTRKQWKRKNPPGVYMLLEVKRDGVLVDAYWTRGL